MHLVHARAIVAVRDGHDRGEIGNHWKAITAAHAVTPYITFVTHNSLKHRTARSTKQMTLSI